MEVVTGMTGTKPAPEAVAVPQAIGTRLPDSGLHYYNPGFRFPDSGSRYPNTSPSHVTSLVPPEYLGVRMMLECSLISSCVAAQNPHPGAGILPVPTLAVPAASLDSVTNRRRMASIAGLSQEEQEFLEHHRLEDLLRPVWRASDSNIVGGHMRGSNLEGVQPIPTLAVPTASLDSVTPVQSPEKYESGNAVRFAPSRHPAVSCWVI
ncbi:hypothetical protein FVEG_16671 [Fusarium verticillioides 7600]|uniref:Uncharacterized protein n=1 Tax=Gibberella moniliformis (strain M3125 / FGSC 7600) TaxID=334819 RepID=W7MSC4_GIBM7|nr:hypothetical protein FVEG_16671 [Fusarium verticillioides 7600]EWG50659.1 hypothetical protein FVEG_16671 [Fusarium verticillioides 7600]